MKTLIKEAVRHFGQPVILGDVNFKPDGWHGPKVWAPERRVGHPKHGRKSWRGLFATWCYIKAGIPTFWDFAKGQPGGPPGPPAEAGESPRPGLRQRHAAGLHGLCHLVSTSVPCGCAQRRRPGSKLKATDGNGPKGQIQRRPGDHEVGKDNYVYRRLSAVAGSAPRRPVVAHCEMTFDRCPPRHALLECRQRPTGSARAPHAACPPILTRSSRWSPH
ncbi:MAG: hypothetical protein R3E78_15790 [Burkholderiaceae bacterium]